MPLCVELAGFDTMQYIGASVLAVFVHVLDRRQDETAGKPAGLFAESLSADHLKGEFPSEKHLDSGFPGRGLHYRMEMKEPAPVAGLDDAARAQPQRREMESDHPFPRVVAANLSLGLVPTTGAPGSMRWLPNAAMYLWRT